MTGHTAQKLRASFHTRPVPLSKEASGKNISDDTPLQCAFSCHASLIFFLPVSWGCCARSGVAFVLHGRGKDNLLFRYLVVV
jgi:hypothetical protein